MQLKQHDHQENGSKVAPKSPTLSLQFPTYDAQDLMRNGDQAHIILGDQTYTLRMTRSGKLILTK